MPDASTTNRDHRLPQLNRDLSTLPTSGPSTADAVGLLDPTAGTTVFDPPGSGPGWWVGAPSAWWTGERLYLSYRIRRPKPERGNVIHVGVSSDGVSYEPIWQATKTDFDSTSLERSALVRVADDMWRLYVSYVDGADGRWRIDLLEATAPDGFDPTTRKPVLTAAGIDAEGVKDPWVARLDDGWCMVASYASKPEQADVAVEAMHGTNDIYNTGLTSSMTGFATSRDGVDWQWKGRILQPSKGDWDAYASRLNSIVGGTDGWLGWYDGAASVSENYEERCGLVTSDDLRSWRRIGDRPMVGAAGGAGTVRYVEAVQTADWTRFYYEYTRPDGSHELRTLLRDHAGAPG